MTELTPNPPDYSAVRADIVALLDAARQAAARSVNAVMTATYWSVGRRIVEFEQGGQERASYGTEMIKRLGADLSREFGRGYGWRNLTQMRAFYLAWPADQILQTTSATSVAPQILQMPSAKSEAVLATAFPLPWSAYVRLLSVKNPQARAFYETEALRGGWTIAQLDRQIGSQFYERTALSNNKAAMLEQGEAAQDAKALRIFRDRIDALVTQRREVDEAIDALRTAAGRLTKKYPEVATTLNA